MKMEKGNYTAKQKNKRHAIKKQMNKVVGDILKFDAIAKRAKGEATRRGAMKIVTRKELELNELWFEYNRFRPEVTN